MAVKLVKPINYKNIEKITDADFEKQLKLLGVNSKFIVALSGGPDSLAPVSYTHLTLPTNREV